MTTKSDFVEWKNHPCTQECDRAVREAIEAQASRLIGKFVSHEESQFIRGFIQGVQAVRDWEPEFNEG
jgi:hypothetical protein